MNFNNMQLLNQIKTKALEFGITEEVLTYALYILAQNKDLVNAMDNSTQMDEYIYRAVIKHAVEKRKKWAEANLFSKEQSDQLQAEKDLSILSREELMSDPYYRAILPIISKVIANEPILRLHADEAADVVLKLADFKRRYRATSITEIIITKCSEELKQINEGVEIDLPNTYFAFA
jgi:L-rhamnose isomerase